MDKSEELARIIDENAWYRLDTLVGFVRDRVGANQFQEVYSWMWSDGVRTPEEAREWCLKDGTRVGCDLQRSLRLANRIIESGVRI